MSEIKANESFSEYAQRSMNEEEAEVLARKKEEAKHPYIVELEEIKARTNKDGFEHTDDIKRKEEIEAIIKMIDESNKIESKEDFDFSSYMKDFSTRNKRNK